MNQGDSLEFMRRPMRWPLRVVLPLVHATRRDEYGSPAQAFLAYGHASQLFVGNVGSFRPGEFSDRARFETALERFESVSYLTLEAVLGDGWRVD